jgi:hypothetical protein
VVSNNGGLTNHLRKCPFSTYAAEFDSNNTDSNYSDGETNKSDISDSREDVNSIITTAVLDASGMVGHAGQVYNRKKGMHYVFWDGRIIGDHTKDMYCGKIDIL